MSSPTPSYPAPPPPASNLIPALVGGALLALVVANVYLFVQIHDVKADALKTKDAMQAEIETLKEGTASISASSRKNVDSLKDELDDARRHASMAASEAKSEAMARIEREKQALEASQRAATEKVSNDLTAQVKGVADSTTAKFNDVTGDVSNVKKQVDTTRSELQQTNENLKRVQGDLGVTSGYVATNGKELAELKMRGERNYFEFKLGKTKQPQRVGDISLTLRKADPKHNRFTLEVLADDKHTEKRDKTINEPVQFFTAKSSRQPYEIVVNSVGKDQITGYLSTPKVQDARN